MCLWNLAGEQVADASKKHFGSSLRTVNGSLVTYKTSNSVGFCIRLSRDTILLGLSYVGLPPEFDPITHVPCAHMPPLSPFATKVGASDVEHPPLFTFISTGIYVGLQSVMVEIHVTTASVYSDWGRHHLTQKGHPPCHFQAAPKTKQHALQYWRIRGRIFKCPWTPGGRQGTGSVV